MTHCQEALFVIALIAMYVIVTVAYDKWGP